MTRARDNADTASGGLVLINTVSETATSSLNINNIFSSTYTNYRLIIEVKKITNGTNNFILRMRTGTTNETSSNYDGTSYFSSVSSVTDVRGIAGYTQTSFPLNQLYYNNSLGRYSIDIFNPFATTSTIILGNGYANDAAIPLTGYLGGACRTSTSYDGINLSISANTFDATVKIYGYKD